MPIGARSFSVSYGILGVSAGLMASDTDWMPRV